MSNIGPIPVGKGRNISVAIWDRQLTMNGKDVTLYSVSCQESYYDDKEQAWKNTGFFRPTSLLALARALEKAYDSLQSSPEPSSAYTPSGSDDIPF